MIDWLKEIPAMEEIPAMGSLRARLAMCASNTEQGELNSVLNEAYNALYKLETERDRWKLLVEGVADAITSEGRNPEHHRKVMARHRAEWLVLWDRIDLAVRAVRQ